MTECSPCGKFFTGDAPFDRHRVGKHEPLARRCLETHEMEAIGMYQDKLGRWAGPVSAKQRAGLERARAAIGA